jgi:pyruvate/2-oxoglutarate/acetoin dehydrogenase E1 component
MATGAGRQLAAQHAHIPSLKVLAPVMLADARGMLWTALADPVLLFENNGLYSMNGELPADAGSVEIAHARVCGARATP